MQTACKYNAASGSSHHKSVDFHTPGKVATSWDLEIAAAHCRLRGYGSAGKPGIRNQITAECAMIESKEQSLLNWDGSSTSREKAWETETEGDRDRCLGTPTLDFDTPAHYLSVIHLRRSHARYDESSCILSDSDELMTASCLWLLRRFRISYCLDLISASCHSNMFAANDAAH